MISSYCSLVRITSPYTLTLIFGNSVLTVICYIILLICLDMQDDIWSSRKNWQLCWACKGRWWRRILIITVSCRVWDTNRRFTGPICKKYQCCHCQNCFPQANVLLCLKHFLTSKDSVCYKLVIWGPQIETSGLLITIYAPPVSIFWGHMTSL